MQEQIDTLKEQHQSVSITFDRQIFDYKKTSDYLSFIYFCLTLFIFQYQTKLLYILF